MSATTARLPVPDPTPEERLALQRRLVESSGFRLAEDDPQFLDRPEITSVRLMLEYMKPQMALLENDVESTVVLFGSARLQEPTDAARRAETLRLLAARAPEDAELARRLRAAEHQLALSRYYEVARDFSFRLSRRCQTTGRREFVVVTGGGPGIMEAGNRGGFEAGRHTLGLNIQLPHEQLPNPFITPDLCFRFRYFAIRKMHFLRIAKALIAFPGGFGTFDELFEVLCLIQTRTVPALPVVLVGEAYWRKAFDADWLAETGMIDPEDLTLFSFAETAEDIWNVLVRWYGARGVALPNYEVLGEGCPPSP
jgi:uncharacterized protein (TIGR00730 family)